MFKIFNIFKKDKRIKLYFYNELELIIQERIKVENKEQFEEENSEAFYIWINTDEPLFTINGQFITTYEEYVFGEMKDVYQLNNKHL